MTRTYAITDLHGRYDLLIQALNTIFRRPGGGTVITLGDYVDRGPESRQIISHLMTLRDAPQAGWKVICLKGNHEDMMYETLMKPLDMGWWVGNGGGATLKSYNSEVPSNHLHWINQLPSIHTDKHRVFVHAGVDPARPLDDQTEEFKLWYRYTDNADIGHGERHVVHGHTPNPLGPEKYKNRTNLDTLAWRTGRLVVAVFDDEKPGPPIEFIEVGSPVVSRPPNGDAA
jgi:serine/threonine protein phosphatase 1